MNEMKLDADQRAAIEFDDALVLAGPGSGKTRTLVAKAAKEIHEGQRVWIVTFTVSASEEISKRMDADETLRLRYTVSTLHSMCLDIMHDAGMMLELADESMMEDLANGVKETLRMQISNKRIEALLAGDKPAKHNERLFCDSIQKQMQENGMVSYNGMLTVALQCLKEYDMDWRKGENVTYLIDEAQDSGPVDLEIYDFLSSTGAHLWMVGDMQQAIFSFRHPRKADVFEWWSNDIIRFARMFKLPTNYRSSEAVIKTCNVINETFVPRIEGKPRKKAPKGSMWYNRQKSVTGMHLAIRDRVKDLMDCHSFNSSPDMIAVLCRTNAEVEDVGRFLQSEGVNIRSRRKDAPARVPERLWAALSVFVSPESDWRVKRWFLATGGSIEAADRAASTAAKEMKSLISYFVPELLEEKRTPKVWINAMDVLLVPKNEQSWFFEHVGDNWESQSWDEITLQLFETGTEPEEGSGVTVTTVHQAKGREWPHVLMAYCDSVSYSAKNGPEEERIFFVGASRAIETLVCYCAEFRDNPWTHGEDEVKPCAPLARIINHAEASK